MAHLLSVDRVASVTEAPYPRPALTAAEQRAALKLRADFKGVAVDRLELA